MDKFTELTAPAATLGGARRSQSRTVLIAATSALLLCCALIAISTQDGSHRLALDQDEAPPPSGKILELPGPAESPGITDPNEAPVEITGEDMAASEAKVKSDLDAMATQKAGTITGSVPTDEEEASAIIDGADYIKHMGEPFWPVTGPHSDDAAEADSIIDHANADNMDVTGKAGATLYAAASDPSAPASAWMRGSIPNYRAESNYILSGVFGNYEKELENQPTMAVVSGKLPPRTVAYDIIEEAYKDKTSPDCTGSVDKDGVHGVGKGTPPCTAMLQFRKPVVDVEAEVEKEEKQGEAENDEGSSESSSSDGGTTDGGADV